MNSSSRLLKVSDEVLYDSENDLFYKKRNSKPSKIRPLSVAIRLGRWCMLECKVCLANSITVPENQKVRFQKALNWLSDIKPLRVIWTGGEPTLYPELQDLLVKAVNVGFFNVVTTNMCHYDPLINLAGDFFYNVSLFGVNETSFHRYTGKNLFRKFISNFESLFKHNHLVFVNIRIEKHWDRYLPHFIDWIKNYPVKKLLLSNTILTGRLTAHSVPADRDKLQQLREFIREQNLPFPVLLPSITQKNIVEKGYIIIEHPPKEKQESMFVNNEIALVKERFLELIWKNAFNNYRLFTAQNYIQTDDGSTDEATSL